MAYHHLVASLSVDVSTSFERAQADLREARMLTMDREYVKDKC